MPVSVEVKNATSQLDAIGVYSGGTYRVIPAPLVSIAKNYQRTATGVAIGATLSIQLTGTILATLGNPVAENFNTGKTEAHFISTGFSSTVDINDDYQNAIAPVHNDRLGVILAKQEALRILFGGNIKKDGSPLNPYDRVPVKLLLEPLNGSQAFVFLCDVENISFEEGIWYDKCNYTIDLTCNNWSNNVSEIISGFDGEDQFKYLVSDIQESWDIQEAENTFYFGFLTSDTGPTDNGAYSQKVWDITHNVNVVGKRGFSDDGTNLSVTEAYANASGLIYDRDYGLLGVNKLTNIGGNLYSIPSGFDFGFLGSVVGQQVDDGSIKKEYNLGLRSLVEQRDLTNGSVSVTESFIYAPRNTLNIGATEQVSLSVDENVNSPIKTYNLQGTVRGLNTRYFGHTDDNAWINASGYYTNYVEPFLLERVSRLELGLSSGNLRVNPTPLSKSVSKNPINSEISYNVSFDTRRQNLTSALAENISIREGLVGNIYSEIPIIGRKAGPIIQYLDSNTARSRSLNISLVYDFPEIIGSTREQKFRNLLLYSNPRIANSGEIIDIINGASPLLSGEAPNGVVFDPPEENWSPDTGEYTYSITWKWESPKLL